MQISKRYKRKQICNKIFDFAMKYSIILFIQLISSLHSVHSRYFSDCAYDKNTSRVEYICGGSLGERFGQRTSTVLYCDNYSGGINRSDLHIVTFNGCQNVQYDALGLSYFPNIRIFNISSIGIEALVEEMFESNEHLEIFLASHNKIESIPSALFAYKLKLMAVDFSYNKIRQLASDIFDSAPALKTIRLAYNEIIELHKQLFFYLDDLELIDISGNRIFSIESSLLSSNKKLKSLILNNNPLVRLKCEFLLALRSYSMTIFVNFLYHFQANCENESEHTKFNVIISSNESTPSALTVDHGNFEWSFNETDFMKIQNLNFSNSHVQNIAALLEGASTGLMTLDLSNTFVGELTEKTFYKFSNLQFLHLSRTNLSNFQFGTFYHQKSLKTLDLAYNNLKTVDFQLFLRNFQQLESLNLEGNDLTEIDTITRTHFPKLTELAISKNRFSCDYLVKFLLKWPELKLIHNPSNRTVHVGGVDCMHENEIVENGHNDNGMVIRNHNNQSNNAVTETHLKELYAIKILLVILILVISVVCLYAIFAFDKCKHARKFYKHWTAKEMTTESISFSNQEQCSRYNEADNNNVYNELSIRLN